MSLLLMAHQLITSDPTIMMVKPIVAGTRITVELVLEKLAAAEGLRSGGGQRRLRQAALKNAAKMVRQRLRRHYGR
jgi:hypothetical protein